jgi:hypothetical protein
VTFGRDGPNSQPAMHLPIVAGQVPALQLRVILLIVGQHLSAMTTCSLDSRLSPTDRSSRYITFMMAPPCRHHDTFPGRLITTNVGPFSGDGGRCLPPRNRC